MRRHATVALIASVALAAACPPLIAADSSQDKPIQITLYPAPEPQPALKYQLLPPLIERRPGNAALHYCKVPHEQYVLFSDRQFWDTIIKWIDMPLAELRKQEGPRWITRDSGALVEALRRGSRCETCDWDFPFREEPFWGIYLPEVQQTRASARILAARARLQIADGKYDEAVQTLQIGYALGRHVARAPFLVNSLVGVTIAGMMNKQLEQLIQQPGAPNLYWALATLPHPLVDFRPAYEGEMASLYFSFPELRDLEKKQFPAEQWRYLLEQFADKLMLVADRRMSKPVQYFQVLQGYPRAKRAMVQWGYSAAAVEAMPVAQVVLIYTIRTYDQLRDDQFKWMSLPYAQARKAMDQAEERLRESIHTGREIIPVASILLPALRAARTAEVRFDRDLAALQALEAIRLYGAAHGGKLPDSLADITEVPVPIDPIQGQPFLYRRDGDRAFLESASPYGPALRYQIQFARKGQQP